MKSLRQATSGFLLFLLSETILVNGHSSYQANIPNGDRIPHPCEQGKVWAGVGHLRYQGMGARNQFGIDFKAAKLKWTRELCMKDSDQDGQTNGQEMGDPACVWVPGAEPATRSNLSHPGVCEPLDTPHCRDFNKQQFSGDIDGTCATKTLNCPAISEPDVKKEDIRLPLTPVPAKDTSYVCMLFDMPSEDEYQLVGTTPLINNTQIVHHIIMFGCVIPEAEMAEINNQKGKMYPCGMSPHLRCLNIIGTWTVGSAGDCVNEKAGFRIGVKGYRIGALQVHWNNQEVASNQHDSSGLTIYYTNRIRNFDSAVFMVGQEYLQIPPRNPSVSFDAVVPSDCTAEMLREPIYVTRAVNHMHYLGKSQQISVYRRGQKVRELTNDHDYNYDHPQFYHFDPPVEVLPGDEIRTTCTYNSEHQAQVTYYGEGTSDEMCYGFVTYYPDQSILPTMFASWKSQQRCHRYLPSRGGIVDNCPWKQFLNQSHPETQRTLKNFFRVRNCGYYAKFRKCNANCSAVAVELSRHSCFQGAFGDWMKFKLQASPEGGLLVEVLDKCVPVTDGAASTHGYKVFFVAIVTAVFHRLIVTFTVFSNH